MEDKDFVSSFTVNSAMCILLFLFCSERVLKVYRRAALYFTFFVIR